MLPLGIYYLFFERESSHFYGFKIKGVNLKPYAMMLCLMLPLIAWASFQVDFMATYPSYKPGVTECVYHLPAWQTESIYEVLYCLDFTTIELIYRGFMVIGMAGIMGRASVFPMVATYAFLHFGKPMAEAISSIAGGFILGVIAYYTRSIIGGIIIHAGIALGMDVASLTQLGRLKA
jgi:membrane protease YdiL (CAAX protease family)